jgi:HK97 family phage major capsid protein
MAELDNVPTLQQQIQGLIKATADGLELKTKEQLASITLSVETINQKLAQAASKQDFAIVDQLKCQIEEINSNILKNQVVLDNFVASESKRKIEKKGFEETWLDAVQSEIKSREAELKNFQHDKTAKLQFKMNVKDMTLSSITGDQQQGYNSRQGLAPAQRSNFRDLIPTTPSPTGSYVTFRETNTLQAPGIQTENNSKTDMNYAFTEVKSVSKYIAGKVDFSKQLMFALPFLNNTLPRMLLRDFYKKENDYFYVTAAQAATGVNTISGSAVTVDAEELLHMIANQLTANFDASYAIVDWRQWARILATKPNDYSIPGGVVIGANGSVSFAGTPLVGASWAQTDHALIFDRDIMERVETESLRVEFSYENNDNFEKNMVTARVECFEELNILRPDGVIYRDFGNS